MRFEVIRQLTGHLTVDDESIQSADDAIKAASLQPFENWQIECQDTPAQWETYDLSPSPEVQEFWRTKRANTNS